MSANDDAFNYLQVVLTIYFRLVYQLVIKKGAHSNLAQKHHVLSKVMPAVCYRTYTVHLTEFLKLQVVNL